MATTHKNGNSAGWKHTTKKVLRTILVFLNNCYVIPAYIVYTWLLWPIHFLSADLYWKLEGYLCRWMFGMVASWMWTAGYKVAEVGDDVSLCAKDETLVLLNHQSTSDVPVVMSLVQNKGLVPNRMMWIMDRIFMYTQFGMASMQRGDFFIQQGKVGRERELERLQQHMLRVYPATRKQWIILFPEGGFLWKRREASQRYAKKNGYPVLEHVTLPRIGAIQGILKTLLEKNNKTTNSHIPKRGATLKWVIDATIGYEGDPILDLITVASGGLPPCTTTVHYRIYRADLIPRDTEGLTRWLYKRYTEKEELLAEYYRTGKFPVSPSECNGHVTVKEAKLVTSSVAWFVFIHVFYMASTYFQWRLLVGIWGILMAVVGIFL